MSPYCSQCGKENAQSSTVCQSCGSAMPQDGPEGLLGKVVFDSYELTEILGQGGMAVVYRGRNKITEQHVAVKVLPPELATYSEVKTRFVDEARTLAKLEHPNIVHLINFAEDLGRLCLVMQYAEGETLEDLIDNAGRVSPREAVRISIQVLSALHHAHRHEVVHRDIKPSNIIVRPDGSIKVTDFGIAKIVRSTKLTQDGQTMGTVRYMSPEQVQGSDIDLRSDIYSLGITLYEAVVGDTPFDGESHFAIMNQHLQAEPTPPIEAGAPISEGLQDVILKSLAKVRQDRFATAEEMSRALEMCEEASPIGVKGKPRTEKPATVPRKTSARTKAETKVARPSAGRRPWLVPLVAAGAVVAGTVLFFAFGPGLGSTSGADEPGAEEPRRARRAGKKKSRSGRPDGRERGGREVKKWLTTKHPKLKSVEEKVEWRAKMEHKARPYLRILSEKPIDTSEMEEVYEESLGSYRKLLDSERIDQPVLVRPLVMVFLDSSTFSDPKIWKGQVEADVRYYPLPVATLFVPAHTALKKGDKTGSALLYGIASHLCPVRLSSSDCHRLAERFVKYHRIRAEK